jgi:hypothetical protein
MLVGSCIRSVPILDFRPENLQRPLQIAVIEHIEVSIRHGIKVVKNPAGALHADKVGCTLQIVGKVKMEIPVKARQVKEKRR